MTNSLGEKKKPTATRKNCFGNLKNEDIYLMSANKMKVRNLSVILCYVILCYLCLYNH